MEVRRTILHPRVAWMVKAYLEMQWWIKFFLAFPVPSMYKCIKLQSRTKCIETGPLHQKLPKAIFKLAIDAMKFFYKYISKSRAFPTIASLMTHNGSSFAQLRLFTWWTTPSSKVHAKILWRPWVLKSFFVTAHGAFFNRCTVLNIFLVCSLSIFYPTIKILLFDHLLLKIFLYKRNNLLISWDKFMLTDLKRRWTIVSNIWSKKKLYL